MSATAKLVDMADTFAEQIENRNTTCDKQSPSARGKFPISDFETNGKAPAV